MSTPPSEGPSDRPGDAMTLGTRESNLPAWTRDLITALRAEVIQTRHELARVRQQITIMHSQGVCPDDEESASS